MANKRKRRSRPGYISRQKRQELRSDVSGENRARKRAKYMDKLRRKRFELTGSYDPYCVQRRTKKRHG